ncbi:MAG: D-alanine--D-alanine ligase [Oligoflexia bacterium]|nr:D-alanine--D-alanine ligase [Oligoflexia bacterium]
MRQRLKVAVLFGGRSVEHEISVISALQMISAMDTLRYDPIPVYIDLSGKWFTGKPLLQRSFYRNFDAAAAGLENVTLLPQPGLGGLSRTSAPNSILPVDVFFPLFHGRFGEDGCIQGLFELAEVPYVGCGVLASAVAMSKQRCKTLLAGVGLPVLPGCLVEKPDVLRDLDAQLARVAASPWLEQFPLFVKPNNSGSSVGIGKAANREELAATLANVFVYDVEALVEPCLSDMFEVNVSVLAGRAKRVSVVEIPVATAGALTYEDKYLRSGGKKSGESQGMASLTRVIDPADLDPGIKNTITDYARRAFDALGCRGVARFDFMVSKADGRIYLNELNSPPGSMAFYLWEKSAPRLLYTELVDCLIEDALDRAGWRASVKWEMEFRALKQ